MDITEGNKHVSGSITTIEAYNDLKGDINLCIQLKAKYEKILFAYDLIEKSLFTSKSDAQKAFDANEEELTKLMADELILLSKTHFFSLCILFDNDKKIWLSLRNNNEKNYYNHYGVPGGGVEVYEDHIELFEDCAIREIKEETGIELIQNDMKFLFEDKFFSTFYSGGMVYCKCYISCIHRSIPKCLEPNNHGEWINIFYKDVKNLDYPLTPSLDKNYDNIVSYISRFRGMLRPKKRKDRDDNDDNDSDESKHDNKRACED